MDKSEVLLMDIANGKFFIMKKLEIEKLQERMNQMLKEKAYEDMKINPILEQLADEIEKKTGKRPVFGPWSTKDDLD